MAVKDKQGRIIDVGTYVIYPSTGTIGEVLEMEEKDGTTWALLQYDELTRLWYNTDYLQVTDKKYKKTQEDNKKLDAEDQEEQLKEQLKKAMPTELSDDAVGGG